MESTLRRTWAQIDLDALAHNYEALRRRIGPGVKFLGVVKADAYGHGAVEVSRVLQDKGADYLAVSSIDEAMELRHAGITMPILILGHTPKEQVGKLMENRITQAVTCEAKALEYSAEAVRLGGTLTVHIKVDSGMSRLGYLCDGPHFETGVAGILHACTLPGLEAQGIFTHFAVSDEPGEGDRAYTQRQFALFRRVIAAVEARWGRRFTLHHCANTGAVARYPETYMDMVRPGLLLYGCGEFAAELGLRPVMTLKTTVSTIKTYAPGTDVHHRSGDPDGCFALRLCRRVFPLPFQPLLPHDRRWPRPSAGQDLHGYVHARPHRRPPCPGGRRGGGFRCPQQCQRPGRPGGHDPL